MVPEPSKTYLFTSGPSWPIESPVGRRCGAARARSDRSRAKEFRGPVEQMLELVLPRYQSSGRRHHEFPFGESVPGFFEYLVSERGLRPASIYQYQHHLGRFEAYLGGIGVRQLRELSPTILSAFIAERSRAGLAKSTVRDTSWVLRVFLRYAHRQGHLRSDLSAAVEWPQVYRLSSIPRSISWAEVGEVMAGVDRRTPAGKRDYAILLLLVTYGLRGREVAALTLDDIDWKPRAPCHPRAQGRAFDRLPAVDRSRSSAGPTTSNRVGPKAPSARCSSGRRRPCARWGRRRCPPSPATI